MNTHTINVIKDFGKRPYGRYPEDGEWNGAKFRALLAEKLREFDHVHVNLDGYNRYGRSFLDEAFGGLIREEHFTYDFLQEHLSYSHTLVKSIESLIADRIKAAARDENVR
ncbi:STAS-like domain-containing protein [Pseudomonas aeruginosa]|uniref:STAS-like domain-containing protein n=1 Tax=Pseudomonas aeruginosa TaxID=287 RepID=UPI00249765C9|nr:STAS-like domain-containing protein [Pseudomonas aeruginosa]MDI2359829.1 STAS-like domain-containing protein [Pseudomonas aeruginosa]MDI2365952.1 STAS-like domain-containing protein [Pseudomonas aeruginosa]